VFLSFIGIIKKICVCHQVLLWLYFFHLSCTEHTSHMETVIDNYVTKKDYIKKLLLLLFDIVSLLWESLNAHFIYLCSWSVSAVSKSVFYFSLKSIHQLLFLLYYVCTTRSYIFN